MAKQSRGRGRYRYRYRRDRCHTAQESIPIPISISIGRIERIGSDCLEAEAEAEAEGLCSWRGSFATEGTEFTERFFLLPSAGRSALQPGAYQMGKGLRLCVLCDLCGRNLLTRGRPKRSMAKRPYSCLRAMIGSRSAARLAGYNPKIRPTDMLMPTESSRL